jgi:hypothetical protein
MRRARDIAFRHAGPLVLIGLLLVPVVAAGHYHLSATSEACGVCVVTQHAPAVATATVAVVQAARMALPLDPVVPSAPLPPQAHPTRGRAPPPPAVPQDA